MILMISVWLVNCAIKLYHKSKLKIHQIKMVESQHLLSVQCYGRTITRNITYTTLQCHIVGKTLSCDFITSRHLTAVVNHNVTVTEYSVWDNNWNLEIEIQILSFNTWGTQQESVSVTHSHQLKVLCLAQARGQHFCQVCRRRTKQ